MGEQKPIHVARGQSSWNRKNSRLNAIRSGLAVGIAMWTSWDIVHSSTRKRVNGARQKRVQLPCSVN
jgi:hypothetical protein